MRFEGTDALRGEALAAWGRAYHADVHGFLAALEPSQLDAPVTLPWASRADALISQAPTDPTMAETVMQVALHSTYHRGQINARIRELGVDPPLTDFIAWVWAGKPQPSWPSLAQ